MPDSSSVPFEDSIANTLGALYEKKARGTTLIRVLEDYRRFRLKGSGRQTHRAWKTIAPSPVVRDQELQRLYLRRAAVDQVIRSLEAYTALQISTQSHT
jgi:hypothetical protein